MFSGITNQVSSLTSMFSKNEEEVPTPPQSASGVDEQPSQTAAAIPEPSADNNNAESQSPTKASGGMFSNVTGKVSGWLPTNLPSVSMPSVSMPHVSMPQVSMPSIPGLRKSAPGEEAAVAENSAEQPTETQPIDPKDDDDRSSATGGADSRPTSEKGTPTEEQPGVVGNVTNKVTAGAKSFGSFFSGAVNKAGASVAKIKDSVKDNTILSAFNKEQEAFIKDQSGKSVDAGVCPWVGHKNEDKIKEEVINLSSDRRNFVRAPPAGNEFDFNYDTSYPIAVALMQEDPQLEKMRFDLVPKIITEENFWRNYFYRVSLIIQAGELGTLGTDDAFGKREEDDVESNSKKSTKDIENVKKMTTESEFISDKFKVTTDKKTLDEVKENMKKLGLSSLQSSEEVEKKSQTTTTLDDEWEKDLAAEIQDFEVVDDHNVDESELDDLK